MPAERRVIAYHEAGHAAAFLIHGRGVKLVEIGPESGEARPALPARSIRERAVSLLAGGAAQLRHEGVCRAEIVRALCYERPPSAAEDFDKVRRAARQAEPHDETARELLRFGWCLAAAALMFQADAWRHVELLAEALLVRGVLTGPSVAEVVRGLERQTIPLRA